MESRFATEFWPRGSIRGFLRASKRIRDAPSFDNGPSTADIARAEIRRTLPVFDRAAGLAELDGYHARAERSALRR